MRLIASCAAQLAADHRSFSQPLLGFKNSVWIFHAFIEHGKLNCGNCCARNSFEPLNTRRNMACQFRQLTAPMRMLGQWLNNGVSSEFSMTFPNDFEMIALKLQEIALQLLQV